MAQIENKEIAHYLPLDFIETFQYLVAHRRFEAFSAYVVNFIIQQANKINSDAVNPHGKTYTEEPTLTIKRQPSNTSDLKSMYPKISIVTPSFNQGQFIEECIDSILSQNYPNLEYIIMDGGSTDNSVEIIKKHEKYLTYWQSQPDQGQYDAINQGFHRATGDIMTWLNADDILHPHSLKIVDDIFSSHPAVEWITGRPNGINEQGKQTWMFKVVPLWSREKYLNRQYKNPYIQQEGTFWKKTLWERAGAYIDTGYKLAGDMELWARFFRFAQLYSVDAVLGAFRSHPGQKTATFLDEYNAEAEIIINREISYFMQSPDKLLLPAPAPITGSELLRSDDRPVVFARGKALMDTKNYAKAKELYEKYLAANPDDAEIWTLQQKCETILQKVSKLGQVIGRMK